MDGEVTNGQGRTAMMQSSAQAVREPSFKVMQSNPGYHKQSVLDTLQPSGNGRSAGDRQRLLMGITSSTSGQADSTFDQRLWLRNERPASLFSTDPK